MSIQIQYPELKNFDYAKLQLKTVTLRPLKTTENFATFTII